MSHSRLDVIARTVEKTHIWLNELQEKLGAPDDRVAYHALRATLHALRDRMDVEQVARLGEQLPLLIRGIYYEGWRPATTPDPMRSKGEFLSELSRLLGNSKVDPEDACRAVFELLERRISPGEIEDVKGLMHRRLRDLWPAHAKAR